MALLRSETLGQLNALFDHLPLRRKREMLRLIPISVLPGLLDLLSIAVIARLMGSILGGKLQNNLPGITVFGSKGLEQALWLVLIFVVLIWSRSLARLMVLYLQERLNGKIWLDLSSVIYGRILGQQYEFHIASSEAHLANILITNLNQLSKGVVVPLLQGVSATFSIVFLLVGVLLVGRWYALALLGGLLFVYLLFFIFMTPYLRRCSANKLRLSGQMKHLFFESMLLIRDIILTGKENFFIDKFDSTARRVKAFESRISFFPNIPKLIIEPLGITLIFSFGALPALLGGGRGELKMIIPFLATLALASLRLTPSLQEIFGSLTRLRSGLPNISKTLELLDLPSGRTVQDASSLITPAGIRPRRTIHLDHVSYRYPGAEEWTLRDLSLSIPVGSRVALVGSTGSGKSTTAQLLLGLLTPEQGSLQIDGVAVLPADLPAWQACCAYVPQQINLLDASVLENVAFAEAPDGVDSSAVWEALQRAQVADLVSDLPYGLHTPIGKNGIQLSGGQRQRLALARAFYRNTEFLLLDEATSALDTRTEADVIQALELIGRRCTTLVIAHRLSTVKRCDRIFELHDGRVVASGTYQQLQSISSTFRELVQLNDHQKLG